MDLNGFDYSERNNIKSVNGRHARTLFLTSKHSIATQFLVIVIAARAFPLHSHHFLKVLLILVVNFFMPTVKIGKGVPNHWKATFFFLHKLILSLQT